MEDNIQTTQETPVEASTTPETATAADSTTPTTGVQENVNASSEAAPEATEYKPDYKVKAYQKEFEIDEWMKPFVNKDTEKNIKALYGKAKAFDFIKGFREQDQNEFKAYKSQTEPVVKTINESAKLYQSAIASFQEGNTRSAVFKMEEAFKNLGISDNVLKQYVLHKLNIDELPPETKADVFKQRDLERQNALLQQQMQESNNHFQQIAVQTRMAELNQATSKPEVASIIQAFDQRNGQGAFQSEVIQRGQLYWQTHQQDVPAETLVQEIIKKYGLHAPTQQQVARPSEVPVIPVVKGGSGSPVGKSFNSIDDLKKYRKEKFG